MTGVNERFMALGSIAATARTALSLNPAVLVAIKAERRAHLAQEIDGHGHYHDEAGGTSRCPATPMATTPLEIGQLLALAAILIVMTYWRRTQQLLPPRLHGQRRDDDRRRRADRLSDHRRVRRVALTIHGHTDRYNSDSPSARRRFPSSAAPKSPNTTAFNSPRPWRPRGGQCWRQRAASRGGYGRHRLPAGHWPPARRSGHARRESP